MGKTGNSQEELLKSALAAIEKEYGKGSIMTLGSRERVSIDVISSGSLALDRALGIGGYPKGRVIEIFGPESSGKTTTALHAVAECQKSGGVCAYIDVEHAIDPVYAEALGVDVDTLLLSQPDSGEQALGIAQRLVQSGAVQLVVIFETWDKDRLMKYTADIYAILPQAVGYFLSPWEECLAAETNEGNLERIGIDLVIEAFIQEISFNGMTEESQEKRRNELDESIRNTNEILKLPREEQEEHFHPVEDLFKELGIVDERTKEEKEESIRQIYVDSAKTNARWLREFLLVAKEYR